MKNQIGDLRSLKEQRDALDRQIAKIESRTKFTREVANKVIELINENKVSVIEVAMMIAPDLELTKKKKPGATTESTVTGRTRKTKIYRNPNTNETIQTKGGNHKQLKEWKAKWGPAEVESWAT